MKIFSESKHIHKLRYYNSKRKWKREIAHESAALMPWYDNHPFIRCHLESQDHKVIKLNFFYFFIFVEKPLLSSFRHIQNYENEHMSKKIIRWGHSDGDVKL